ncbi:helix-turn-helix transcriptional regulator [Limosilactobacillus fermentum]|uniref:helix-turn-helix domain-containing protein n=1 Tax=Limosilactobacillus fermentum TaxID=1613 RepID=UPI002F262CD7
MIKNNLAALMGERGLKIADVYEQTGISKTTLTSIWGNSGKGIQYATLDKLCNFLEITPAEFFSYIPYSIETSDGRWRNYDNLIPKNSYLFTLFVKSGRKTVGYHINAAFYVGNYSGSLLSLSEYDYQFMERFKDKIDLIIFVENEVEERFLDKEPTLLELQKQQEIPFRHAFLRAVQDKILSRISLDKDKKVIINDDNGSEISLNDLPNYTNKKELNIYFVFSDAGDYNDNSVSSLTRGKKL